jgi:hypothetical protein
MGGPGSGNRYHSWRPDKKTVVEDCRQLDANRWMREEILAADAHNSGAWNWYRGNTREVASSISYEVCTLDMNQPWLWLHYTFTASKQVVDYKVELAVTYPRFGGLRWWFICPLVVNGRACGRRVGKLYLPPSASYFGCRNCHRLTYLSAQEHDKRVDAFRRNPEALAALMSNLKGASVVQLMLAVKSVRGR